MNERAVSRTGSKRSGFILVAIALLVNQWSLGYLVSSDGVIEGPLSLLAIWFFDVTLLWMGVSRLLSREVASNREYALRTVLAISTLLFMDLLLSTFSFAIGAFDDPIDPISTLSPYRDTEWAEAFFAETADFTDGTWRFDSYLGWETLPFRGEFINVDENGIRKTWSPEPAPADDAFTIYVFGGSTTWGLWARDAHTIPSYLAKALHEKKLNVRVFNYGDLAYNSTQELLNLILLLRRGHRPDLVVFYDGVNDTISAHRAGSAGKVLNVLGTGERFGKKVEKVTPRRHICMGVKGFLSEYSVFYKGLTRATSLLSRSDNAKYHAGAGLSDETLRKLAEEVATNYANTVEFIAGLSRIYEFEFAAFWQPVSFTESHLSEEERSDDTLKDESLGALYRFVLESIRGMQLSNFYDISGVLVGRTTTQYVDFCHLSEEGNRTVANAIADTILASIEKSHEGPPADFASQAVSWESETTGSSAGLR